jgi:hypothetical protein
LRKKTAGLTDSLLVCTFALALNFSNYKPGKQKQADFAKNFTLFAVKL